MYFTCLHLQKLVPSNMFKKRFQHHVQSTKDFMTFDFCSQINIKIVNNSTSQTMLNTLEPHYNEVLGTMKITLLYQVSHYIRVKKQRNIKRWDQQNYLVIRGFCYIRPLYNEVPLYTFSYSCIPHKHQKCTNSLNNNSRPKCT